MARTPQGTFVDRMGRTVNYDGSDQWFAEDVEQPDPFQQFQTQLADPNWDTNTQGGQFDYTDASGNNTVEEQWGNSLTTPYGPNEGGNTPKYVSYYNPHGGSTFIGVKANGDKEVIDQNTAMGMGYVPPPRSEFGPDMSQPPTTTQPVYQPPVGTPSPTPTPTPTPTPGGGTPTPTPGPTDPVPDNGGFPPGGQTPGAGGGFGWDWDAFGIGNPAEGGSSTGGYYENYVPGKESPWGVPDLEGGNPEFYNSQLLNLLGQEQGYRKGARQAAEIRGNQQPAAPRDYAQMWQDMGMVPNQAAQANDDPTSVDYWSLNDNLTAGETTNLQFLNQFKDDPSFSDRDRDWFQEFVAGNPKWQQSTGYAQAGTPDKAIGKYISTDPLVLAPENQRRLSDIIRMGYNQSQYKTPEGGGPSAAPGYALPVQG